MSDEKRGDEEQLTEEDHIRNYFEAMVKIDRAMEPLREHAKALRQNYAENEWLTRPQMSMILKAYRANKNQFDLDLFNDMMSMVKRQLPQVK